MINWHKLNFLRPAPFAEKITDPALIDKTYRYWRIRTLYSMYIGYIVFYFARKSFTFVAPQLIQDLHY